MADHLFQSDPWTDNSVLENDGEGGITTATIFDVLVDGAISHVRAPVDSYSIGGEYVAFAMTREEVIAGWAYDGEVLLDEIVPPNRITSGYMERSGWVSFELPEPIRVTAGDRVIVGFYNEYGDYFVSPGKANSDNPDLTNPSGTLHIAAEDTDDMYLGDDFLHNGRFHYAGGFGNTPAWPNNNYNAGLYYTDVVFTPDADIDDGKSVYTESAAFMPPAGVTSVDVLVVGGGGAGGKSTTAGGGGGAGGLIWQTGVSVTPGVPVSINVGLGGIAGTATTSPGGKGGDSSFGSIVALGGGGGGATLASPATSGGSGGGAASSTNNTGVVGLGTAGQGHDGSKGAGSNLNISGGGGGGAGSPGIPGYVSTSPSGAYPGVGGAGLDMSMHVGTAYGDNGWFAAGGTGASRNLLTGPAVQGGGGATYQPGMPNTGGGGGGGYTSTLAGSGGSGIVIVLWGDAPPPETSLTVKARISGSTVTIPHISARVSGQTVDIVRGAVRRAGVTVPLI